MSANNSKELAPRRLSSQALDETQQPDVPHSKATHSKGQRLSSLVCGDENKANQSPVPSKYASNDPSKDAPSTVDARSRKEESPSKASPRVSMPPDMDLTASGSKRSSLTDESPSHKRIKTHVAPLNDIEEDLSHHVKHALSKAKPKRRELMVETDLPRIQLSETTKRLTTRGRKAKTPCHTPGKAVQSDEKPLPKPTEQQQKKALKKLEKPEDVNLQLLLWACGVRYTLLPFQCAGVRAIAGVVTDFPGGEHPPDADWAEIMQHTALSPEGNPGVLMADVMVRG